MKFGVFIKNKGFHDHHYVPNIFICICIGMFPRDSHLVIARFEIFLSVSRDKIKIRGEQLRIVQIQIVNRKFSI